MSDQYDRKDFLKISSVVSSAVSVVSEVSVVNNGRPIEFSDLQKEMEKKGSYL